MGQDTTYYILLAFSSGLMAIPGFIFTLLVFNLEKYYQGSELPMSRNPVGVYLAIRSHPDGKAHIVGKDIRETGIFKAATFFLFLMSVGFLLLLLSAWKLDFIG